MLLFAMDIIQYILFIILGTGVFTGIGYYWLKVRLKASIEHEYAKKLQAEKSKYDKQAEEIRHQYAKEIEQYKTKLEIVMLQLKHRLVFVEKVRGLFEKFHHCVDHVHQNERGYYENRLDELYRELREYVRENMELLMPDFPAFKETMYLFTNEGQAINERQGNWSNYLHAKENVEKTLSSIRETIPMHGELRISFS